MQASVGAAIPSRLAQIVNSDAQRRITNANSAVRMLLPTYYRFAAVHAPARSRSAPQVTDPIDVQRARSRVAHIHYDGPEESGTIGFARPTAFAIEDYAMNVTLLQSGPADMT